MNVRQAALRPNGLERRGYAMLTLLGAKFEAQRLIGERFCVDAFVPEARTVVQFDGDYWHANPDLFPVPSKRQERRMRLDVSQDAYMRALGFRVVRLWESDLKKRPGQALVRLHSALSPPALPVRQSQCAFQSSAHTRQIAR
jgi:very-short-patch-repair endonuclease